MVAAMIDSRDLHHITAWGVLRGCAYALAMAAAGLALDVLANAAWRMGHGGPCCSLRCNGWSTRESGLCGKCGGVE